VAACVVGVLVGGARTPSDEYTIETGTVSLPAGSGHAHGKPPDPLQMKLPVDRCLQALSYEWSTRRGNGSRPDRCTT
jgi:hypothetical protein